MAGNVSDIKAAPALLERAGRMRYLLADKGYDVDHLRRPLRDAAPFPSSRPGNRKRTIRYDKLAAKLPVRRRLRNRRRLLAVIESGP